jgi:hypothetical protein
MVIRDPALAQKPVTSVFAVAFRCVGTLSGDPTNGSSLKGAIVSSASPGTIPAAYVRSLISPSYGVMKCPARAGLCHQLRYSREHLKAPAIASAASGGLLP